MERRRRRRSRKRRRSRSGERRRCVEEGLLSKTRPSLVIWISPSDVHI